MKSIEQPVYFWFSLAALASLFMLVILWSVIPFGGQTLPHLFEHAWSISFSSSALFTSLLCGLLGAGTIGFTLFNPITVMEPESVRTDPLFIPENYSHEEALRNENQK